LAEDGDAPRAEGRAERPRVEAQEWANPGAAVAYFPSGAVAGFTGKIEGAPFMVGSTLCVKLVEMQQEYGRPVVKAAPIERIKPLDTEAPAAGSSEDWPAEVKTPDHGPAKAATGSAEQRGDANDGLTSPSAAPAVAPSIAVPPGEPTTGGRKDEEIKVAREGRSAVDVDTRPGEASSGDLGSSAVASGEGEAEPDATIRGGALEPQSAPVIRPPDWLYSPTDYPPQAHCFPDGFLAPSLCGFDFPVGGQVWAAHEGSPVKRCEACARASGGAGGGAKGTHATGR
jgi:hypothetical protein